MTEQEHVSGRACPVSRLADSRVSVPSNRATAGLRMAGDLMRTERDVEQILVFGWTGFQTFRPVG
jgi:hypothetical protein